MLFLILSGKVISFELSRYSHCDDLFISRWLLDFDAEGWNSL
jgi:hypothetical protein